MNSSGRDHAGDELPTPWVQTPRLRAQSEDDGVHGAVTPQWDRVIEIATKLWIDGVYVATVNPLPTQRFVDLLWTAHQAGRVLGGRAKVETTEVARGVKDGTVTVTVRYVDADDHGLERAVQGLEELMQRVLAQHDQTRQQGEC
jgi:hypothetical protein